MKEIIEKILRERERHENNHTLSIVGTMNGAQPDLLHPTARRDSVSRILGQITGEMTREAQPQGGDHRRFGEATGR